LPIAIETASYTEQARNAGFRGKVMVAVTIAPDGTPVDIGFPTPVPFDLDGPASEAVRRSRFSPAIRGGKAIESRILIEVPFR